MEIKSFRIKNYRSIVDSDICYFSGDNITILAGKNESGKTAILEALEDFTVDHNLREEARPLFDREKKPEVYIVFNVDKDIINSIFKEINVPYTITDDIEIEIKKSYPNKYDIDENSEKLLNLFLNDKIIEEINEIYSKIKKVNDTIKSPRAMIPNLDFNNIANLSSQLQQYKTQIQPSLTSITDIQTKSGFLEDLDNIIKQMNSLEEKNNKKYKFIEELKDYVPDFILFSSFDDIFPNEISIDDAPKNALVQDLNVISDLKLDLIKDGSSTDKVRHKEKLNVRLKQDYLKFWSQDVANLHVDWDSENLQFFIKEREDFYPPTLRSQGKRWHLAFYVRVCARAKDGKGNIILIDEPGLFLHAKAQKDVLRMLEDSAKQTPIIFSTHSPYLIDITHLNRIRLISCQDRNIGTTISNKVHKNADKETLTPIITAIGLDLSLGIDIAKNNNIILEGITDYYYLNAMMKILGYEFGNEIHFIPSAGADKIKILHALMVGWQLNHCILLDSDAKGKLVKKNLEKLFKGIDNKIITVSERDGFEIEGLFSREDFYKYILKEDINTATASLSNSDIIKKDDKYDTVLLAKHFFENRESITLSLTSKENFKNLFERIKVILFPSG